MLKKLQSIKAVSPPLPKHWCVAFAHRMVLSVCFDWVIFVLVLVDIILIIVQISVTNERADLYYRYVNTIFVGVYTSEAILKVGTYNMTWVCMYLRLEFGAHMFYNIK